MSDGEVILHLPTWLETEEARLREGRFLRVEDRMSLAIDLARRNFAGGKAGPFGAAVFESESGRLVSAGVNMVEPARCSVLHAEIVAILLAQRRMGTFDLGAEGLPAMELVSSTEPCAMCLGAVPWSGVRRLVCGARDEDARAIGFDEGHKPVDWVAGMESRGIAVVRDVLRKEAAAVLQRYKEIGGVIYNSRGA